MPSERYYIPSDLSENSIAAIEGVELHHMLHVMRTKEGAIIEVINGKGILAEAEVTKINKKHAELRISSILSKQEPDSPLILAQALPRINRLDYIVEKGTELGMTELRLFPGNLSERKSLTEHQMERLATLTIAAVKQCGRLWLPTIKLYPQISEWDRLEYATFFGDVAEHAPSLIEKIGEDRKVMFITGPESGFTDSEEEHLKKLGACGVKLHRNILRTDTASIAALCLLSSQR